MEAYSWEPWTQEPEEQEQEAVGREGCFEAASEDGAQEAVFETVTVYHRLTCVARSAGTGERRDLVWEHYACHASRTRR